eukprot:8774_1
MKSKQALWIVYFAALLMVVMTAESAIDQHGSDGAPCGSTPYKDFGKCNAGLTCERKSLFSSFAPGRCKKVDGSFGVPGGPNIKWFTMKCLLFALCVSLLLNGFCGIWCCRHRRKCINKKITKSQTDSESEFLSIRNIRI